MKKFLKSLILLPMLVLASCGGNAGEDEFDPWGEDGDVDIDLPSIPSEGGTSSGTSTTTPPVVTPDEDTNSKHITYLVLGANGLYKGAKGVSVADKNLENTIIYHGDAGRALPGKDKVTSSVSGVEFVSWISYEDEGKPTTYTKVPAEDNKILYAFFAKPGEGNVPGGNPDQGGGDTDPVTGTTIYVNDTSWENVYVHAWIDGQENSDLKPWNESPKMTKVEGGFSFTLAEKYNRVIFKSAQTGGEQSQNIVVDHKSNKLWYHLNASTWGEKGDDLTKDFVDLFVKVPSDWGENKIYVYAWVGNENNGWPGQKMYKSGSYYYARVNKKYTSLIVNNSKGKNDGGKQSNDISSWTDKVGKAYDCGTNTWINK